MEDHRKKLTMVVLRAVLCTRWCHTTAPIMHRAHCRNVYSRLPAHFSLLSLWTTSIASGFGDVCGHLAEGLSTALQVFDDLQALRQPNLTTQKHCILVCNSTPYQQIKSQQSLNYADLTCQQLLHMFPDKGISFSIISPRKIPVLYKLYEMANGEMELSSALARNFSVDSRHLILLHGYQLTERPVSPGVKKEEQDVKTTIADKAKSLPAAVAPRSATATLPRYPIASSAANMPGKESVNVTRGRASVLPAAAGSMAGLLPNHTSSPMMTGFVTASPMSLDQVLPTSQVAMPQPMSVAQMQAAAQQTALTQQPISVNPPMMAIPQMTVGQPGMGIPQMTVGQQPGMGQPGMVSQMPVPQQQMPLNQPAMMPVPGSGVSAGTLSLPSSTVPAQSPLDIFIGPSVVNAAGPQQGAALQDVQQQQQRTIWSGLLEWQEKQKPNEVGQRMTRSLPCQIVIGPDDHDINGGKWPPKLQMNLIPNTLLSPLQSLFRNSRTVGFNFMPKDPEALNSLFRVMAAGFGGCVNIPTSQVTQQEVKVLMLLYSNRKHQFMGLIPNNQMMFVNGIRSVITQHKKNQQMRMQQQQAAFNPAGAQQGMVVMPAQQMQPSAAGAGALAADDKDRRNTMQQQQQSLAVAAQQQRDLQLQQAVAADQQRQFIAQQQQQQQQQQMQTNNQFQLRHLLQQQMRQPMMMQQPGQQARMRMPGAPQPGLQAPQQNLGQPGLSFNVPSTDEHGNLNFDI